MNSNLYNKGLEKLLNREIDYVADSIRILLVGPSYAFDKSHEFVSDVAAHEVTNAVGTGYERKTLAGKTITLDGVEDRVEFDSDNPIYTQIETNENLAAAIIFKEVIDDTDSPIICINNFSNLVTNGSDVELQINEGGVFRANNLIN